MGYLHGILRFTSRSAPGLRFVSITLFAVMALIVAGRVGADPLLGVVPLPPDRVHPSLTVKVPPFPPQPGTARYILFNDTLGPDRQPRALYLRVPHQFAGDDRGAPVRTWGLNLLVHYPDMTGPLNPNNAGKLGVCAGGCPGEMMVSIYNHIGNTFPFGPNIRAATLDHDRRYAELQHEHHDPIYALVRYSEVASNRFTEVVQETFGTDPKNIGDRLYFIQRMPNGSVRFFADCTYNTVVHLCEAYGALPNAPGVEVDYDFHLENVDDWARIQDTVFRFVDGLVYGTFDYQRGNRQ